MTHHNIVEWIGEAAKVLDDLLELGVVGLSPGIPRLPREGVTARCTTPQMARGGMSHGEPDCGLDPAQEHVGEDVVVEVAAVVVVMVVAVATGGVATTAVMVTVSGRR